MKFKDLPTTRDHSIAELCSGFKLKRRPEREEDMLMLKAQRLHAAASQTEGGTSMPPSEKWCERRRRGGQAIVGAGKIPFE